MRIISGNSKGKRLVKLHGLDIRPTSDRIREAVFNILGPKVRTAKVLDLFAGTGALGIEALSRGAIHATFVDLNCDTLQKNLALCRLDKKATVIRFDIIDQPFPQSLENQKFDLVFIDPPYGKGYVDQTLHKISLTRMLDKEGIIIAEHSCKDPLEFEIPGLDVYRQKKYSKTIISLITNTQKGCVING